MRRGLALVATGALIACSSNAKPLRDAGVRDAGVRDAGGRDARVIDDGGVDDGGTQRDAGSVRDGGPSRDAGASRDGGAEPTQRVDPVPGELTIIQLDLPIGITARLGEAAIIVGPAGSIALLDVGNSNHDDEVRDAIRDLNTRALTPARGFSARRPLQVEWMILTHFHGDHVGAFRDLTSGAEPLEIVNGVVHRGFVDVGDAMNTNDYDELCAALGGPLASVDVPLCVAAMPAPCPYDASSGPHPAVSCPGLFTGDLSTDTDDSKGAPAFIDLDGANITFALADGHVSDGISASAVTPFGHTDSNEENGRSLGGVARHGRFHYWFGGDLTGSGDPGEPDVETSVATIAVPAFLGTNGSDVVHAHHHARRTSSNATFVDAVTPADGRTRNVVAGINAAHVGSPHAEVVEAFTNGGRLAGGAFWITTSAAGGATEATHPHLVVADGDVILQTTAGGGGYRLQAAGNKLRSRSFDVVR